jgi:hypothetical protein
MTINKFALFLGSIFLRFYNEILAGIFGMLIVIPFDSFLHLKVEGTTEYIINSAYFFYTGIYVCFFIASSAMIPYLKKMRLQNEISKLSSRKELTFKQKKEIEKILSDVLICKKITSLEGALQFLMINLFSFGIVMIYFGIEAFVLILMHKEGSPIIPITYATTFFLTLFIESALDEYLAKKLRKRHFKTKNPSIGGSVNKDLLILILKNSGTGGTLSQEFGRIIIEDTIKDILEILQISTSRNVVIKKNLNPIKAIKKGKIESDKGKFNSINKKQSTKNLIYKKR